MSRAEDLENRMLQGIPTNRHDEARARIHKTLAYQSAAFQDALDELGRAIARALRLRSDR